MNHLTETTAAGRAFGKQSVDFDAIDDASRVIKWMRKQVYQHMENWLKPHAKILEMNAGTGIDACYFASLGHTVLATDISVEMLQQAQAKIMEQQLSHRVATQQCDYTQLDQLQEVGKFDHLFSDFGGLNCVDDFSKVARHFPLLLKPGGYVTLVMISPFCLWETLLAVKGNFKVAFRRFKKRGAPSHLEGELFTTYYYGAGSLQKAMGPAFTRVALQGLAVCTPPPYLDEKFTDRQLKALFRIDEKIANWPVVRSMGDHFIVTFQYRP